MFEMQGGMVSQDVIFAVPSTCFLQSSTTSGTITPLEENKGKKALWFKTTNFLRI